MPSRRRKPRTSAPLRRTCGTMAVHMALLETQPSFRGRLFRLEQETALRRAVAIDVEKLSLVTIKVVVHVVSKTREQQVSDAQVESQIASLNRDYAAENADRSLVPAAWKGLVTDSRIRFKLADVTRTSTARSSFSFDDAVKAATGGGSDPVHPESHLNLWVCALDGGLLGYAQFPGGPAATDGVVIHYRAFGTRGTAQPPFDKGRTTTHEVGHYLNLRHIWGDTEDCSGTDAVADTPNSAGPNYGAPAFPVVTCNNGPNGDMFMNYMDYVDDAAMCMFTAQQVVRMRTALEDMRRRLIA